MLPLPRPVSKEEKKLLVESSRPSQLNNVDSARVLNHLFSSTSSSQLRPSLQHNRVSQLLENDEDEKADDVANEQGSLRLNEDPSLLAKTSLECLPKRASVAKSIFHVPL